MPAESSLTRMDNKLKVALLCLNKKNNKNKQKNASLFSPVFNGSGEDVTILPLEQVSDSRCGKLMFVAVFFSEQDNVSDIGCLALFFPNHKEVVLREFLCLEGAK